MTENAITKRKDDKPQLVAGSRGILPRNLDELWRLAQWFKRSSIGSKFQSVEDCAMAIELGLEVGVSPFQAVQNIAVIKGTPRIYGDLGAALVQASGNLEWQKVDEIGEPDTDTFGIRVTMKRREQDELYVGEYTVGEAKLAGLWGKTTRKGEPTPWVTHPKRMLYWRAWTFAARDGFADCLKGLAIREEVDYVDAEVVSVGEPESDARNILDAQLGIDKPALPAGGAGQEPTTAGAARDDSVQGDGGTPTPPEPDGEGGGDGPVGTEQDAAPDPPTSGGTGGGDTTDGDSRGTTIKAGAASEQPDDSAGLTEAPKCPAPAPEPTRDPDAPIGDDEIPSDEEGLF